ncbi:uncharacterized protein B0T23DRAFT_378468, partial [Neurospora hispaniola]
MFFLSHYDLLLFVCLCSFRGFSFQFSTYLNLILALRSWVFLATSLFSLLGGCFTFQMPCAYL